MYERKPSDAAERHHYEYAFACLGQQSVKTTAVSKDVSFELAGDATACASDRRQFAAADFTSVLKRKLPSTVGVSPQRPVS
jgi:hypothetical protein